MRRVLITMGPQPRAAVIKDGRLMRIGTTGKAALLLFAAGPALAGGPVECAAQTGADSVGARLSLSAAVAEARKSPFHAGANGAEQPNGQEEGIVGTAGDHQYGLGPQEDSLHRVPFGITFVLAELSHLAGTYMFLACGLGSASGALCVLGPVLPLPVVALPAMMSGVDMNTALGASAVGWLAGLGAFMLTAHITERIRDVNFITSALVSGLVHGVTTTVVSRWRRSQAEPRAS